MSANELQPTWEESLPAGYEAIRTAIARGYAGQARHRSTWLHHCALVLAYTTQGLFRVTIAGRLGYSTQRITQLREEGCAAILRGAGEIPEAETVCADRWRRWCSERGDANACARVSRSAEAYSA
jgi:hypothetical protein